MSELTGLEREIVSHVARDNWPGFRLDGLTALTRDHTGAGRYTTIEDSFEQPLPDGSYSAQGKMIEIDGVADGLGFVVNVTSSRISLIEVFTFGPADWDGAESNWKII